MRLLALACLPLLSGCISYSYERHRTFESVSPNAVSELEIGVSDVGDVLAKLGAPLYVWEGAAEAVVLAYGSENRREHGFSVSVPLFEQANASFAYDDVAQQLDGYVLVFDADLKLEIVRVGILRELSKVVRVRPSPVE
jgi:hypothetical protein